MTSTSETLNKAADLIEQRGWTKGNPGMRVDKHAPLCLEGAIAAASGVTDHRERPIGTLYAYSAVAACPAHAAVTAYLGGREPWAWNDDQRTAAEVIEVLRAAAVIEAARENADTTEPARVNA